MLLEKTNISARVEITLKKIVEDELKLMHRNLKNIGDLMNFEKYISFSTEVYCNEIMWKNNRIKQLSCGKT